MPVRLAERIVDDAIGRLQPAVSKKIVCLRSDLQQAILAALEEAFEIGFLAGRKELHVEPADPGLTERPPWMDIPLNDVAQLKRHGVRLKPVVLNSLMSAGFTRLGDLRWVPAREFLELHYIGRKTARQIASLMRTLERPS